MTDQDPTDWTPAFEGQRPPFAPGNTLAEHRWAHTDSHGAYSPRKVDPLARELVESVLADGTVPSYAKAPAYRLELWELARAEAKYQLIDEWLARQAEGREDGLPDFSSDAVRSALLAQHRAATRASTSRQRLGLTPSAAARMGKDVAIGQAAAAGGDVAQRMAMLAEHEDRLLAAGWQPPAPIGADASADVEGKADPDDDAGEAVEP